jgi:mRNA-degrading endonuclease RelE of RelBE toxin-antitoxin system
MTSKPPVRVDLAPEFVRRLKQLLKKYRHAFDDVQGLIRQLENGESLGDQVQGAGYPVYKVRLRSSDLRRGKSGGYRVIYYLKTSERIIFITIYIKTEQADISGAEIRRLIDEFEHPPE